MAHASPEALPDVVDSNQEAVETDHASVATAMTATANQVRATIVTDPDDPAYFDTLPCTD